MYTFQQKRAISQRIADVQEIERYRTMLMAVRHPGARKKMLDKRALAISLVYDLLGYYTEKQICNKQPSQVPVKLQQSSSTRRPGGAGGTVPVKKKVSKFEQYPNISWREMDNTLVRTADSIFTDRINLWQRLREIEENTEGLQEIEAQTIEEFITKTIRLELCFSELKAFNDTGKFIGKHPFISERDERARVTELLRSCPYKYFKEWMNIELNITRYSSQINGKKATPEARKRASDNLDKFKALLQMYKEVFQEYLKL